MIRWIHVQGTQAGNLESKIRSISPLTRIKSAQLQQTYTVVGYIQRNGHHWQCFWHFRQSHARTVDFRRKHQLLTAILNLKINQFVDLFSIPNIETILTHFVSHSLRFASTIPEIRYSRAFRIQLDHSLQLAQWHHIRRIEPVKCLIHETRR